MSNLAEPPSDNVHLIVLLIAAALLLLLSMLFSASESAFLSINKLRLKFLKQKKNPKAIKTAKLLDQKDKLINTLLISNNLVNIALSAIVTTIALKFFDSNAIGIATFITTIALLIFGEITPKNIGSHHAEGVSFTVTPIISFFVFLLKPIVKFFTFITHQITRILGINTTAKKVSFTEEDIKHLIEIGEEEGVLESSEKKLMHRVFKFTDLAAKDIMIPRTAITAVNIHSNFLSVIELSQKSHLSQFPVYDKDLDDIKGILHMKDVLLYANDKADFNIKKIMRPPLFILENKKMSSIQQMLQENNQSVAIIMDEYSETEGLLTTEDIAKQIFGIMYDEYDTEKNQSLITQENNTLIVSGNTKLLDLQEKLGISLQTKFYETISGYLMEKMDSIPQVNDSITIDGYIFTVLTSTGTKLQQIKIEKKGEEE